MEDQKEVDQEELDQEEVDQGEVDQEEVDQEEVDQEEVDQQEEVWGELPVVRKVQRIIRKRWESGEVGEGGVICKEF